MLMQDWSLPVSNFVDPHVRSKVTVESQKARKLQSR